MITIKKSLVIGGAGALLAATAFSAKAATDYYGTTQEFAKESIYFLMTDRFTNGDTSNDFQDQGCHINCSFNQKTPEGDADIGYMGGDFKGIVDNIDYIKEMGFSAVWITPIVENPDSAYTGGGLDANKSGYHGYWGTNFYTVDEHLESSGLNFQQFVSILNEEGVKVVLDIVANHGSHGFGMTQHQWNNSNFGRVFDKNWNKICDHENKPWGQIAGNNCFLNNQNEDGKPFLGAPLAEFDQRKQFIKDYLNNSFLQWIDQGVAAFRIDTVKHVPESYWAELAELIRAQHPGFYLFGEYFSDSMAELSNFQNATNISVLDFAGKSAMQSVFGGGNSYANLAGYLDLENNQYKNSYDLATFYDNHDMPRMNASDNGFIDAHNWLFTTRGVPVLYYGSEMGFQRGKAEHDGNRDFYGPGNISNARNSQIFQKLKEVVALRQSNIALQMGIQVNVVLNQDIAVLYRVYQKGDVNQTALVLLNKGNGIADFHITEHLSDGRWVDAKSGELFNVNGSLNTTVAPHDVKVLLFDQEVNSTSLIRILDARMRTFPQVFFRGTPNGWDAIEMKYLGNNTWETVQTFGAASTERFKFDIHGDWSLNYGDNQADGIADQTGADILIMEGAGNYRITFHADTKRYSLVKQTTNDVYVTFFCEQGYTQMGQSVYVVGDNQRIGNWASVNAVKLDPNNYPTWGGTVAMPANTCFEWKCIKRDEQNADMDLVWQPGGNNKICTGSSDVNVIGSF